jgi:hypothetical protein
MEPIEPNEFSAPKEAGAVARGEGWLRLSLAGLVSNLPAFPSALD